MAVANLFVDDVFVAHYVEMKRDVDIYENYFHVENELIQFCQFS